MSTALDICDLSKVYENGLQALRGVSLRVEEGDFCALLGPNGAGKSTLIGILTSLVRKSSGTAKVFGLDIDHQFAQAKSCMGVVPQEFNFNNFERTFNVPLTQAGYYGLPLDQARQRTEKYLRLLGLWDKRDQKTMTLSGGMKRRLMIARAMVHEPRLLILDEPTAGVDIALRRSTWDFLRELNASGTTIILTTHYLEEAEALCRNIAIIDHGRIVQHSSTRELLRQLNRETFLFDVAEQMDAPPMLEGYRVHCVDPHCIAVEVERDKPLGGLFEALQRSGLHITSMRNKSSRLEELFVSLVGDDRGDDA